MYRSHCGPHKSDRFFVQVQEELCPCGIGIFQFRHKDCVQCVLDHKIYYSGISRLQFDLFYYFLRSIRICSQIKSDLIDRSSNMKISHIPI